MPQSRESGLAAVDGAIHNHTMHLHVRILELTLTASHSRQGSPVMRIFVGGATDG